MTSPSQIVIFDLAESADQRFDPVIEGLLVAVLAFAPLALGAVHPWSEAVVVGLASAMLLCLMGKLLVRPDVSFVFSRTYIPIVAFLSLVCLQLLPLPSGLVRLIAPGTYALRVELLEVAGHQIPRTMTISLYPEATITQFRMLLAVVAVYVVTLNVVRRMRQVRRILAAVAVIGTLVAGVALAQNVTDTERIYWLIPIHSDNPLGGPFVNYGHFAQFMNLSIGASMALLLIWLDQLPRRRDREGLRATPFARPITPEARVLACAIVAMAVAVPLSMSRGGLIAMLAAGTFTAVVLVLTRGLGGRTWIFVGLALAAFAALLVVRPDAVLRRASSIASPDAFAARTEILRGVREMWPVFPVLGSGLGTFEFVFPMFDQSATWKIADHAENEYAEVLAETGLLGLLMALAFIGTIAAAWLRSIRTAPSPMASAATGLGFGLWAILVHSAADFGQHIPANALLTAVTCALVVNLAHASGRQSAPVAALPGRAPLWRRVAAATAVMAAVGWLGLDAGSALRAQQHRGHAAGLAHELEEIDWRGSDLAFARLLDAAQSAAERRPRDARLRYELNRYRWKTIERGVPVQLSETARRHASRVVDELLATSRLCPTFSMPYLLSGQIERYALDGDGESLIRTAHRLSPNDPTACIALAIVEAEHDRWDASLELFHHAVAVRDEVRDEVIEALAGQLRRPDAALELAWDDRSSLDLLLQFLKQDAAIGPVAETARQRHDELLLQEAAEPHAPAALLAEAARAQQRRGEHEEAIALLRRAAASEYSHVAWRLELAEALSAAGEPHEALNEARAALRLEPGNAAARALVESLSPASATQPTTLPAPTTTPATRPGFRFD